MFPRMAATPRMEFPVGGIGLAGRARDRGSRRRKSLSFDRDDLKWIKFTGILGWAGEWDFFLQPVRRARKPGHELSLVRTSFKKVYFHVFGHGTIG